MVVRLCRGHFGLPMCSVEVGMATALAPMVRPFQQNVPTFNPTRVRYSEMTDVELVSACKRRNREAFKWLFRRHQSTVFNILYKLAPDWQDTSDLVQDVFVRLWSCIGTLHNPHAFRGWLR